ncbi:hypothetical protein Rsub_13210 [Raphidocelis subcapitata]|uniref:non-specific serine/threonine protein kinase n=1 Tax=Raphidocelis subcapitata TaxID=307507 RepID=A0A2V0PQJ1_9CHLO|nr:hypothetical protein Rsub_13210 [Raphidocelis subcapitata]|eukprot:GBG00464.1 hypothetical protein Rsub_13210 [Raphidocelis subcapitata]
MTDTGTRRLPASGTRGAAPAAATPLLLLLSLAMFALPVSGHRLASQRHLHGWRLLDLLRLAPYLLSGTTCGTTCPVGTFADTDARKCTQCPTGCTACTSATVCTACASTLWRTADWRCVAASDCPVGTFPAANRVCSACAFTCATCSAGGYQDCTSCGSSRYLLGTACVAYCPAGTRGDNAARTCAACPTGCAACSSDTVCTTCNADRWRTADARCADLCAGTTCPSAGECDSAAGVCDAATGVCGAPTAKPDNTTCILGSCQGGVCTADLCASITCPSAGECDSEAGVCDPATGVCGAPTAKPDNTACSIGLCWTGKCRDLPPSLAIAAGAISTCALAADTGVLRCCGDDYVGQATPPAGLSQPSAIAMGDYHICVIAADTGAVRCWGGNDFGQATPPANLPPSSAINAGTYHTCAIAAETSAVSCWGADWYGQATPPANLPPSSAINAGDYYTCAIAAETGAVRCWGADWYGQTTPPADLPPSSAIATSAYTACALAAETGAVRCWGNTDAQATPVDLPPSSALDGCGYHMCVVAAGTGAVRCWGSNGDGQAMPPADLPPV